MSKPPIGRGNKADILEALKSFNINTNPPRPQIGRGIPNHLFSSPSPAPTVSSNEPSTSQSRGVGRGISLSEINALFERETRTIPNPIENKKTSRVKNNDPSDPTSNVNSKEPVIKLGKSGHSVNLSANFLRLSIKNNYGAYEYRVFYSPEIEHKAFRIKMLKEHSSELGKDLTFDGDTLFLPQALPQDVTIFTSKHPIQNTTVTLKIKFIKKRELANMMNIFNILFKRIMITLNYARIGRECYNMENSLSIPQHKLKLLPGYVTAVSTFEDGLMLNMDPLHKVIRTQTVLSEIYDISQNCQNIEKTVKNCLIGKSVITPYNGKLYTVDDVDFSKNPLSNFKLSNGNDVSFLSYYKTQYGKDIKDLKQPLLISKHITKKQAPKTDDKFDETLVCLVPELCYMTGLTDEMRDNRSLMKDLSSHMKITPNQRYLSLKNYVDLITTNKVAKEMLNNWGLEIEPLPISLSGRELQPENILFGNSRIVSATKNADWNKGAILNPVITPVDIDKWVILYTQRDAKYVKDFCDCILRCGQMTGIKIASPKLVLLSADKPEFYVNALKTEINQYLQLVVCICPNNRDDRYAAIKKVCCVDLPIPSQVINGFTLSKPQKIRSIAHKILLQINCKLGGTLWSVPIPYPKLMVVGLDVYHSKTHNLQSVCGFVASYNQSLTRWYSRVCFQKPGQEIVDQLRKCFLDSIKLYMDTNGFLPDRIIVYRDGVGDGQFNVVKEYEISQLESCFEEVDSDYKPNFTFLVVQKRNNTRIFTSPSKNATISMNPNPGTIVDNTVTRRYLYDFYVVAHKAREGSLVPTHYIVLHDTSKMEPDYLQRITFKMCHLYFNWPGTVRVPAPCQYAHKLAFLIGTSVKREHDIRLADRLFFL